MKRIRAANTLEELRIFSLTGMIGSDNDSTPGEKALELEIDHAVAVTEMYGGTTPYLNMNHMPGLTYAYVIGRAGGVTWKGDPSRDADEFLEALREALAGPQVRPLTGPTCEDLEGATETYFAADFARARKLAAKVASRFGKKKGEYAARTASQAAALVEAIDGTLADLGQAFDMALKERDAEAACRAMYALRSAFPKSDAASAIEDLLEEDPEFAASVDAWTAWLELERARPPAFPERAEKGEKRYARTLEKYVKKNPQGPGQAKARAWLERYAAID